MNPRILISNDDGIYAPGLQLLAEVAHGMSDDVWIVAPDFERSGASRSVSLAQALRVNRLEERRIALNGTPTDCVVYAFRELFAERAPDLVLSGINRGPNLADDLTYSGTVSIAMEAAFRGVKSIALSQVLGADKSLHWDAARGHVRNVLDRVLALDLPRGVFTNVNFPPCAASAVRGMMATRQGRRPMQEIITHPRTDARGFDYFWLSFIHDSSDPTPGTDLNAIANDWISVTPVHAELTHEGALALLRGSLG